MTSIDAILNRLQAGRPLILGPDPRTALRARGVPLEGPAPLGRLVREAATVVADHYDEEIASGVDVLGALTAETTSRALGQIGMAFRAAALTGCAVDLADEAAERAPRTVAVAGLLGARGIGTASLDRITEEYALHATRLATAGCAILIARGFGPLAQGDSGLARLARIAAVSSASATELPTWALIDVDAAGSTADGEPLEACVKTAESCGAQLVLFDVPSAEVGLAIFERFQAEEVEAKLGFLLSAEPAPPNGTPQLEPASPEEWAHSAKRLVDAGARAIGGGAGTTARHIACLARVLGRVERGSIWPRAV